MNTEDVSQCPAEQVASVVHRLAIETLVEIFKHHAPRNDRPIREIFEPEYTWLDILHVCRRWRSVAIANPSWWTNIITVEPTLADFMLENSKPLPITLTVDVSSAWARAIYARRLVKENLRRLRTLRIGLRRGGENAKSVFEVLAQNEAPLLREIELVDTDHRQHSDHLCLDVNIDPASLRVASLSLKHCNISIQSADFLSNITSLTMKSHLTHVHPTLSRCKALTFLHLISTETIEHGITMGVHSLPSVHPSPITLPHLRHLHLEGPVATHTEFTKYVSFPLDATLELNLKFERDREYCPEDRKLEVELPALLDNLERWSKIRRDELKLPIKKLHLQMRNDIVEQGVEIHAFSVQDPDLLLAPDGILSAKWDDAHNTATVKPDLALRLGWLNLITDEDIDDANEVARQLCRRLALSDVTHLGVCGAQFFFLPWWPSTFGQIANIEKLAIYGDRTASIVHQLLYADVLTMFSGPFDLDGQEDDPVKAGLTEDDLKQWTAQFRDLRDFTLEHATHMDDKMSFDEAFTNNLGSILRDRESAGLPRLRSLAIRDCDIAKETVLELEGLVDKVVWDRKERGWYDARCITIEREARYREEREAEEEEDQP